MELKFLTRLDGMVFRHLNPSHVPASGKLIVNAFYGSIVFGSLAYLMQIMGFSDTAMNVVGGPLLICLFAYMLKLAGPVIEAFGGWAGRIAYAAYIVALTYVVLQIALIIVLLVITVLSMIFAVAIIEPFSIL